MDSLLVNLAEQCLALTDVTLNDVTIFRIEQSSILRLSPDRYIGRFCGV